MDTELETVESPIKVVYDGQCPFCRWYVDSLAGDDRALVKEDARCSPQLVEQLQSAAIDINQGITLLKGGQIFQGAEALTLLARHHAGSVFLKSIHHRLLYYRLVSVLLYPFLRLLRNGYLKVMGQKPIDL